MGTDSLKTTDKSEGLHVLQQTPLEGGRLDRLEEIEIGDSRERDIAVIKPLGVVQT